MLQKRAIRIISGLKYKDPTTKTFAKFKRLKFEDIILMKTVSGFYENRKIQAFNNMLQKSAKLQAMEHKGTPPDITE